MLTRPLPVTSVPGEDDNMLGVAIGDGFVNGDGIGDAAIHQLQSLVVDNGGEDRQGGGSGQWCAIVIHFLLGEEMLFSGIAVGGADIKNGVAVVKGIIIQGNQVVGHILKDKVHAKEGTSLYQTAQA